MDVFCDAGPVDVVEKEGVESVLVCVADGSDVIERCGFLVDGDAYGDAKEGGRGEDAVVESVFENFQLVGEGHGGADVMLVRKDVCDVEVVLVGAGDGVRVGSGDGSEGGLDKERSRTVDVDASHDGVVFGGKDGSTGIVVVFVVGRVVIFMI